MNTGAAFGYNPNLSEEDYQQSQRFEEVVKREGEKAKKDRELKASLSFKSIKHPTAEIQAFSEIVAQKIIWVWRLHIAIGKLTLFVGNPGLGKSQGGLDISARCSLGKQFPDGTPCPLGDTIILTSENDPADTMRPRLDALGADVTRIHIIKGEKRADGTIKPITLKSLSVITDAINQIRGKGHKFLLLIIDPLDSFLGGVDSNCNEDVREILDGITDLAEKEHFAVLGIKHLNKDRFNDAAYRVGGSIAFSAKARAVWVFTQDKNTGRRLFLPLKNNLAPKGGGYQYSIQQKDTGNCIIAPFIQWEGPVDEDVQEILNSSSPSHERSAPEQEAVLELLHETEHDMGTGEIAEALGKTPQGTYNILNKLKDRGKVISPKYGRWEVTPVTPVTLPKTTSVTSTVVVTPTQISDVSDVSSVTEEKKQIPAEKELEIY